MRSSGKLAGFISLLSYLPDATGHLFQSLLLLPYLLPLLHSLSQPHLSSCLCPSPNLCRGIFSHERECRVQVTQGKVPNQLLLCSASLRTQIVDITVFLHVYPEVIQAYRLLTTTFTKHPFYRGLRYPSEYIIIQIFKL